MRIKKQGFKVDRAVFVLKIAFFLALGVLSVRAFDAKIKPFVTQTLLESARSETLSVLNLAVSTTANEFSESVIVVEKDQNGNISAVTTNAKLLTLFQTSVSENVNSAIKQMHLKKKEIPIGSLSGLVLLNGRGVGVPFYLSPLSQVKTELKSEFVSAGVNQTKHRIVLTVSVLIKAEMPLFSNQTHITADYCLAETIIVGQIPEVVLNSK